MSRLDRLNRREPRASATLIDQVRDLARPLEGPGDLDPLIDLIGDSRFVLLGEASHGTAEFYDWRTMISQRLITEKGFSFIAVEGDWPDCERVDRYIKGLDGAGESARDVLNTFERWPTWMWANQEVVALVKWLQEHNQGLPDDQKAGFHGLDVYSLWESLYAVMGYLQRHDPKALPTAWQAFRCFEPYGEEGQEYAQASRFVPNSCENEVVALLQELRGHAGSPLIGDRDARFSAEQNAWVLKNAEAYYRTMVRGGPDSWNLRDRHMAETLDRLTHHYGPNSKAIVWAHNTHIGDARYTDMASQGELNIGQLVREEREEEGVVLVGFGSHRGTVIAGRQWEAPMERMRVPNALPGSWEAVLQGTGMGDSLLLLSQAEPTLELLQARGHRAIGVVYRPELEHLGNYVPTVLPQRYDAFLFLETTQALQPLHLAEPHHEGEVPETYPSGV